MADYQKNVDKRDPLHDPILVAPIEKDRGFKEEFTDPNTLKHKPLIFSALISYFKKILSPFASKNALPLINRQQLLEDLLALRTCLQTLSGENQSHNPDYIQHLGELWHTLLNDFHYAAQFEKGVPSELAPIPTLIDEVHRYPPGEEHSLGFYFDAYAGKEWLPFPFMDILEALHQEFQQTPSSNALKQWLTLINEAITSLETGTRGHP